MTKPEFTCRHRVRNWSEYNQAQVGRGRLTLWFDEDAVARWRATDDSAAFNRMTGLGMPTSVRVL